MTKTKTRIWLWLAVWLAVFVFGGSKVGVGQTVLAYDDANNYASWTNGSNAGHGFGAWDLWNSGEGGHFLGSSHFEVVNTGGKAFGMWGSSGYANAQRILNESLRPGREFRIELNVFNKANGVRGIDLMDSDFNVLFNFQVDTAGYGATGWGYMANSHIVMRVVPTNWGVFQVYLSRGAESWTSGPIQGEFDRFKLYVGNTSGGSGNDFSFNKLQVVSAGRLFLADGLRMPGTWNGWTNATGMGGDFDLVRTSIGTWRWQSSFQHTGASGVQEFKFTSTGLNGDVWANQWAQTALPVNQLTALPFGVSATNNSISLTQNKWYTVLFEDRGYTDSRAIFMETSAEPVKILSAVQSPGLVANNQEVTVTATLSAAASPEEVFYLRYTTDGWETSTALTMTGSGSSRTASIPGFADNTTVSWYVFSSAISNLTADFDMYTLHLFNNGGLNFSYTVGQQAECEARLIATDPVFPRENQSLTIMFNASLGNGALAGYAGGVYAHTGVITNLSQNDTDWRYVKTQWGENTSATLLSRDGADPDLYTFSISDIRTFYGVPAQEEILKLAMVFRSDGITPVSPVYTVHQNADGSDILIDVYDAGLHVKLLSPARSGQMLGASRAITVCAAAQSSTALHLYLNDLNASPIASNTDAGGGAIRQLSTLVSLHELSEGLHWIYARAVSATKAEVLDSVSFFIRGGVETLPLPGDIAALHRRDRPGIHYAWNETAGSYEATLVLHDPPGLKQYAFVIGDFNNWQPHPDYNMHRSTDGMYFWTTVTGMEAGVEYAYQYYIDGELRLADPYTEKVLDPWNDHWISSFNYPNLKPYPHEKTTGIASVLQPGRQAFQWEVTGFQRPDVRDLVIYELHIRDFTDTDAIKSVMDKLDYLQQLGINAIELMPINEFEGNDSWGYNPSFYFATDKAYGTREDYKRFINECHKRGIAVILDVVFNHSFSQSPFVQMYFDALAGDYGKVSHDNPWYNVDSPNPAWSWGFDFDHDSPFTRDLLDRFNAYWLEEFRVDGFRFDFTKGFTNTPGEGWEYDPARIAILKRMADFIWATSPGAYVILEHLTDNPEEKELADYGMLIWGNMDKPYAQAAMGHLFHEGSNLSDLSRGLHTVRGYNYHNLIAYMESHDEQRQMYEVLNYGNSAGSYNTRDFETAMARGELAAAFYFLIPGPKMIWQFGELGYEFPINHCPDGTVSEGCRTSRKPIPWNQVPNYFEVPARRKLYDTYAELIRLKKEHRVFRTGNIGYDLWGAHKRLFLTEEPDGSNMQVVVLGNFDVTPQNINPSFPFTGTWYEHFSGTSLNVSNTEATLSMQPGEYRLYSSQPLYAHYYAKASGDQGAVTGWGDNTDGTGNAPAGFTGTHTHYHVHNQTAVVNSSWTVSGDYSRVFVGNGAVPAQLRFNADATLGIVEVASQANITVSADKHLTINEWLRNEGTVVLEPGARVTVSGTLSNQAGPEGLVLQSTLVTKDKSGTVEQASLIHNTAGVEASVQRYMPSGDWGNTSTSRWHLLSSPVSLQAISPVFTPTGGEQNYDFYGWDEATAVWVNVKDNNPAHGPLFATWNAFSPGGESGGYFMPGRGYLVSYRQNHDPAFNGRLHVADMRLGGYSLTGDPGPDAGWHLLGNPFASALNLPVAPDKNAEHWQFNGFSPASVKIWSADLGTYIDVSTGFSGETPTKEGRFTAAAGIIPPTQGFMIQTNADNASLNIPASARTHHDQALYKSAGTQRPGVYLLVREAAGSRAQPLVIGLDESATDAFDFMRDTRFLQGGTARFYQIKGDERLSTGWWPDLSAERLIELGFSGQPGAQYQLQLTPSLLPGYNEGNPLRVLLLDRLNGHRQELSSDHMYTFTDDASAPARRFELSFDQPTGLDEMQPLGNQREAAIRIHAWQQQLHLHFADPQGESRLEIFEAGGRLLHSESLPQAHYHSRHLPYAPGVYLVRVIPRKGQPEVRAIMLP